MKSLDLSRWAIVGVKDETGTGRMSQDLKRALNPIRHLVGPSYRHAAKPLEAGDTLLECAGDDAALRDQLAGLQGIIVLEDPDWALRAIRAAHGLGVKVVYLVLWEWMRFYLPEMQQVDLFICPHDFAAKVVRKLGFRNAVRLPWPLDLSALPQREIAGPARRFAHNVGLFEPDDRKGTRIVLEAFRKVRRTDVELVVRLQNRCDLPLDDPRIRIEAGHLEHHSDLYRLGDVAVQPSKCEGLGFMLLEAMASGLPVLTTNYPPMNEYVRNPRMLVATRWGKYPAEQTFYIHQAHFKLPRPADLARRIEWCAENDLAPIAAVNRAWVAETFRADRVRREWEEALGRV